MKRDFGDIQIHKKRIKNSQYIERKIVIDILNDPQSLIKYSSLGNAQMVKLILERGIADPYKVNLKGNTAIMRVKNYILHAKNCESLINYLEILSDLIKAGSSLDFINKSDLHNSKIINLLYIVISHDIEKIKQFVANIEEYNIEIIFDHIKLNNILFNSECQLIKAVIDQDTQQLNEAIKSNRYDINYKDQCGNTALKYAVTCGKLELVQILLDAGADIAITDAYSKAPMHYAMLRNNQEIIDILDSYNLYFNVEKENIYNENINNKCEEKNNSTAGDLNYSKDDNTLDEIVTIYGVNSTENMDV